MTRRIPCNQCSLMLGGYDFFGMFLLDIVRLYIITTSRTSMHLPCLVTNVLIYRGLTHVSIDDLILIYNYTRYLMHMCC